MTITIRPQVAEILSLKKRRKSSDLGHKTLLISYHRINYIENVTVNPILFTAMPCEVAESHMITVF